MGTKLKFCMLKRYIQMLYAQYKILLRLRPDGNDRIYQKYIRYIKPLRSDNLILRMLKS